MKEGLAGAQEQINTAAKANVAAVGEQVRANQALAATYKEIGIAAGTGSETAAAAAKLAIDATVSANTALGVSSEETAAQITAIKAAVLGTAETVQSTAAANVAATVREIVANQELAATYGEIAAAAKAGSAEQLAAARLAATAAARGGLAVGAGAAAGAAGGVRAGEAAAAEGDVAKIGTAAVESEGAVAGLSGGLGKLGAVLGIAVGADITFKFVKSMATAAAQLQKSVEVIKNEFKGAAEPVLKFGEVGARALGISADQADATSAKFGILFKNLHIGPPLAAQMTVNLEKLAGSLGAIRGVDPSTALNSITLAMLGNTRSLKQLGVAVDPASEKIAAFKLGLISSTKDALTPAIKAEAIYALATANLGGFMDQAKLHANDLSNVQRRLTAAWSDAKDTLGKGLLPPLVSLLTFFTTLLPPAIRVTQAVFRDLAETVKQFVDFVKPALAPVESFVRKVVGDFQGISTAPKLAVLKAELDGLAKSAKAVGDTDLGKKIAAIQGEVANVKPGVGADAVAGIQKQLDALPIKNPKERVIVQKVKVNLETVAGSKTIGGGFQAGIDKLKKSFEALTPAGKGVAIVIGGVVAAIAGFALAALSPWIAIPLAVGALAVAFQEAYKHSARFREIVGELSDWIKTKLIPALQEVGKLAAPAFAQLSETVAKVAGDIKAIVSTLLSWLSSIWSSWGGTIKAVVKNDFEGLVAEISDVLKIIGGVFDTFKDLLHGKWGAVWGDLKGIVKDALDAVGTSISTWGRDILLVFQGIWNKIDTFILRAAAALVQKVSAVVGKVTGALSFLGKAVGLGGVGNPLSGIADALLADANKIDTTGAANAIADSVAKNTAAAIAAKTRDPSMVEALNSLVTPPPGTTSTTQTSLQTAADNAKAAAATTSSAVTSAKQQLAGLYTTLAQQRAKENSDITAAVAKAKQNLVTLASNLGTAIGNALNAPIAAAGTKIQNQLDKIALTFDAAASKISTTAAGLQLSVNTISAGPNQALAVLTLQQQNLQNTQAKIQAGFDKKSAVLARQAAQLALQSAQAGLTADKRALGDLLGEGGFAAGSNTKADVRSLRAEAKKADPINRASILDYIQQVTAASLQVKQDQNSIATQKLSIAEEKKLRGSNEKLAGISLKMQGITTNLANKLAPLTKAINDNTLAGEKLDYKRLLKETPLRLKQEALTVTQDTANALAKAAGQALTELAVNFNKTGNVKALSAGLKKVLSNPTIKKAVAESGAFLGASFLSAFNSTSAGVIQQALAIHGGPQRPGSGQASTIVRPIVTMQADTAKIHKTQVTIGNKQTALQKKIADNTKKAADASAATAAVLLGPTATALTKNHGSQSKTSRTHTNSGG